MKLQKQIYLAKLFKGKVIKMLAVISYIQTNSSGLRKTYPEQCDFFQMVEDYRESKGTR